MTVTVICTRSSGATLPSESAAFTPGPANVSTTSIAGTPVSVNTPSLPTSAVSDVPFTPTVMFVAAARARHWLALDVPIETVPAIIAPDTAGLGAVAVGCDATPGVVGELVVQAVDRMNDATTPTDSAKIFVELFISPSCVGGEPIAAASRWQT